jgi:hypothetical protein
MHKTPKKVTLSRETLRNLERRDYQEVVGGATAPRNTCYRTCGCAPTAICTIGCG